MLKGVFLSRYTTNNIFIHTMMTLREVRNMKIRTKKIKGPINVEKVTTITKSPYIYIYCVLFILNVYFLVIFERYSINLTLVKHNLKLS